MAGVSESGSTGRERGGERKDFSPVFLIHEGSYPLITCLRSTTCSRVESSARRLGVSSKMAFCCAPRSQNMRRLDSIRAEGEDEDDVRQLIHRFIDSSIGSSEETPRRVDNVQNLDFTPVVLSLAFRLLPSICRDSSWLRWDQWPSRRRLVRQGARNTTRRLLARWW